MSSPFGFATLVLIGPSGKLRFDIGSNRASVGRTPDNDIVLQDPAVSSRHGEFIADATGLVLRDLGSSNGCYVNGQRVQSTYVWDNDLVKLGQHEGRIQVRDHEGRALVNPASVPAPPSPEAVRRKKLVAAGVGGLLVLGLVGGGVAYGLKVRAEQEAQRQLKAQQRKTLGEYQSRLNGLLALAPCAVLEEELPRLKAIDRLVTPPDFGVAGKLGKAEKVRNEELVALLKRKIQRVDGLVERMTEQTPKLPLVPAGSPLADGLKAHPELEKASRKVDGLLDERAGAAAKTLSALAAYRQRLGQYISTIEAFNNGAKDYLPVLSSWRWAEDPEAALGDCPSVFSKTKDAAQAALADLAP
jgi:hypothetical protein